MEQQTPEQARALRASRRRPPSEPIDEVHDEMAGEVPVRIYRPGAGTRGGVVYLHGGGWVIGDLDSHDNVCRSLANRAGVVVVSVDYRLAPEHPFPAGLTDAVQTLSWTVANAERLGIDPDRLAIAGDSAGANLAAVVATMGVTPLRFQLLIYPVTDARRVSQSYTEQREGPFLTAAAMGWFIDHYLSGGHGTPDDPRVSPLLAPDHVLAAGPPAWVLTAEHDPLRDEGEAYGARLSAVGVPTVTTRYEGMIHGFVSLADFIGDGKVAIAEAAEALATALAVS